jgi:hypothetical protein
MESKMEMTSLIAIAQIAADHTDPANLLAALALLGSYRSCKGRYLVMDPHDVDWQESLLSRNNRYTSALAAITATLAGAGRCDVLDLQTQTIYDGCKDAAGWSEYRDTLPPEPRTVKSLLGEQVDAMFDCIANGNDLSVAAHARLAAHYALQILG